MNKTTVHIKKIATCFVLFISLQSFVVKAQTPTSCFEIESILVDGCDGSLEGQNEMVRFVVGNTALNTANLTASWPNTTNLWLGICQNASTALAVAQLNATITNCGYLKEPAGGVLPAGARVILVTSTAFNPSAQSFANLSDTLYIIFQCSGNTAGHFANFGTGTRTLTMSFSPPAACSDVVTYNRASLIMQNGSPGGQDGGAVEFSWSGAASYVNLGCQAPFIPLTVDAGAGSAICGGSASLLGSVSGTTGAIFWQGGSGVFSNPVSLSTTYTPSATESGPVLITLGVLTTCNDTILDSVIVTVNSASSPVANAVSYCQGEPSSMLTATGSNLLWYTTATGGAGSAIAPTPNTAIAGTINYYVSQTLSGCESLRTIVSVTVDALPNVDAGLDQNIPCGVTNATLSGLSSTAGTTYNWTGPGIVSGGSTLTPTVNSAGTYFLTVSDLNGCSAIDSANVTQAGSLSVTTSVTSVTCFGGNDGTATATVINGAAPYSYSWSPSGGSSATATALSAGNYTITVTDQNSCSTTATAVVAQPAAITSSIISTPVSCFNGNNGTATVTPTGGTAPYLFSWSPSGGAAATASSLSAGTYTVTVTDALSCSVPSSTIILQPNSILAATITNTPSTCGQNNGTASIIATGGTSPYTYSWAPFGGSTANATGLAQGTYTITIADANSCTIMINTSIANSSLITTSISLTPIDCFGGTNGTATIAISGGNTPYSILWNTGQTSSGITNLSAGNYCATVIDAGGCRDSACIVLSNPPQINADFTSNLTVTDIYNTDIYFTDQSSIGANNWFWNFGDTTFSNSQDPVHTYNGEGVYPVTLIVTDAQGCIDTVVHEIIINDGFTFYAPNTFTPDGNENNDIFLPKGEGWDPQSYQLSIFDRWGNLCFNTSDPYKGWDGKVNKGSNIAQVDVYVWKVQVSDMSRNFHYYIGSVTILKH
ncbi:MAG: hypothetical protein A3F72_07660 [Bacteroidetes bacterium RIFCSPLOWO2_12_FULL_35_15]|nr:MAG: hypothetical protein A3F72_07660 [Bacteroidetes bacterium RIFCSPLOWO2_12_FULL_35_15]